MTTLPTVPGLTFGVVAVLGALVTIQCTRCHETRTDWPLYAVGWAPFPSGHQKYDTAGHWETGERLCPDCRRRCGCSSCLESLS
jgi:hypothetical protein